MPSSAALRGSGVDERLYERVLQPFLAGVFLEPELNTSRYFLDVVLRSFLRGTPSLPARGMRALPEQLHAALPENCVHLGERVTEVSGTTVNTDSGNWNSQALIVATDASAAARFIPGIPDAPWNGVATWYFASADGGEITHGLPTLAVDAAHRGPILNAVALSHASPTYAPAGKTLVAASTLDLTGSAEFEREIRKHLATTLGVSTSNWDFVGRYQIEHALPAMLPPFTMRKPVEISPGVYVAGDHRDTSSIQGAMVSGRRAADAALRFLGHTVIT
jgi:protoporphyrinogen oxidase